MDALCSEEFESKPSFFAVVRHIVFRTLPWQKVVEHIRAREITTGIPSIRIYGAGLELRTIKTVVGELRRKGLLLRIELRPNTEWYTGLHLPNVMRTVQKVWGRDSELDSVVVAFEPVSEAFDLLKDTVAYSVEDLKLQLTAKLPPSILFSREKRGMRLVEAVKAATKLSNDTLAKKEAKRAGEPFVVESHGKQVIAVRSCFAFWYRCMRDAGVEFVEETATERELGKMRNWINERRREGLNEDEIRERMQFICDNWVRIRSEQFTVNNRVIPVTYSPLFEFYYDYRRQLNDLLEKFKEREAPQPIDYGNMKDVILKGKL